MPDSVSTPFDIISAAINNLQPFIVTGVCHVGNELHGFFFGKGDQGSTDLGIVTDVNDINDWGGIVGTVPAGENTLPMFWTTMTPPPTQHSIPLPSVDPQDPGGPFVGGNALGINNNSEIVGSCWQERRQGNPPIPHAFIYELGQTSSTDLNTVTQDASGRPLNSYILMSGIAINDNGQIAGLGKYLPRPSELPVFRLTRLS